MKPFCLKDKGHEYATLNANRVRNTSLSAIEVVICSENGTSKGSSVNDRANTYEAVEEEVMVDAESSVVNEMEMTHVKDNKNIEGIYENRDTRSMYAADKHGHDHEYMEVQP